MVSVEYQWNQQKWAHGISVQPLGFIAVTADDVKFIHIDDASIGGNIDSVVESIVKLVKNLGKKKGKEEAAVEEEIIVEVSETEESPK